MTDGLLGHPISFVEVLAWDADGHFIDSTYSNDDGSYQIDSLDAGIHYLASSNIWDYEDELYRDIPCPNSQCDVTSGTPVGVQLDQQVENIEIEIEGGCFGGFFGDSEALCLTGNRFHVAATWRTTRGDTGVGQARQLTNDSGYFWFFAENNVEVVVKVLDACTLPGANNFWVFAGGLTDVEVTLTITDTQTGEVRTYVNPLGTPFQPIQDTSAFDTCP